jgi:hypothetical protein
MISQETALGIYARVSVQERDKVRGLQRERLQVKREKGEVSLSLSLSFSLKRARHGYITKKGA